MFCIGRKEIVNKRFVELPGFHKRSLTFREHEFLQVGAAQVKMGSAA